jgi:hypothetical protein
MDESKSYLESRGLGNENDRVLLINGYILGLVATQDCEYISESSSPKVLVVDKCFGVQTSDSDS